MSNEFKRYLHHYNFMDNPMNMSAAMQAWFITNGYLVPVVDGLEVVGLDLTELGKIWLGLYDDETPVPMPDTEPQAIGHLEGRVYTDNVGTAYRIIGEHGEMPDVDDTEPDAEDGYTWKYDILNDCYVFSRDGERVGHFNPYDNQDDYAEQTVGILNTETEAQRERIAELEGERDTLQKAARKLWSMVYDMRRWCDTALLSLPDRHEAVDDIQRALGASDGYEDIIGD